VLALTSRAINTASSLSLLRGFLGSGWTTFNTCISTSSWAWLIVLEVGTSTVALLSLLSGCSAMIEVFLNRGQEVEHINENSDKNYQLR
jgi:hypothetical protein